LIPDFITSLSFIGLVTRGFTVSAFATCGPLILKKSSFGVTYLAPISVAHDLYTSELLIDHINFDQCLNLLLYAAQASGGRE
jgi:hypothetical protein